MSKYAFLEYTVLKPSNCLQKNQTHTPLKQLCGCQGPSVQDQLSARMTINSLLCRFSRDTMSLSASKSDIQGGDAQLCM